MIKYLAIGSLFFIILLSLYIRSDKIEKSYQFNGTIEKVTYGDKKTPKAIINSKPNFISYPNEDFNDKIEVWRCYI